MFVVPIFSECLFVYLQNLQTKMALRYNTEFFQRTWSKIVKKLKKGRSEEEWRHNF